MYRNNKTKKKAKCSRKSNYICLLPGWPGYWRCRVPYSRTRQYHSSLPWYYNLSGETGNAAWSCGVKERSWYNNYVIILYT